MNLFKNRFGIIVSFFLFLFLPFNTVSAQTLPVVTVINPIREPGLQKNSYRVDSLETQWKITKEYNMPAAWLWQPTALENKKLISFAKSQMQGQEFGLFFEIDREFAEKSHVVYRGRGPWYFSDGLLLVSYDQDERKKLIDTAFSIFHNIFGYYPKTVGAWWIDAYSLDYMHQEYGVIASLRAADQFDLDAYTIWGTPWSIPYVSSNTNAGVPALPNDSNNVVMLQWAARDPLQGYAASDSASLFSTQDYQLHGYDSSYFSYLLNTYLQKPLDNVVVGLEGGFPPESYDGRYKDQLAIVAKMRDEGKVQTLFAKDFAKEFITRKSSAHSFLTKDYLTDDQSFVYTSSNYQIHILKKSDKVILADIRNFSSAENFLFLPNSQGMLRVENPSVIDGSRFPERGKIITTSNPLEEKTVGDVVTLMAGSTTIGTFTPTHAIFGSNVFDFTQKKSINIFWIITLMYISYFTFFAIKIKNKKTILLQGILLFIPLIAASGLFLSAIPFFTKQEIDLLLLLNIFKFHFSIEAIQLILLVPLLLVIIIHSIALTTKKNYASIFVTFLAFLFYTHMPYFPFDRSTYKIIGIIFISIIILLLFANSLVWRTTRRLDFVLKTLFWSFSVIFTCLVLSLFSRQLFVIPPFEKEAISLIDQYHSPVWTLESNNTPIYKAVRPLFYDYPKLGSLFSQSQWFQIANPIQAGKGLIYVPRYLGSDIAFDDIVRYNLQKIFDNGNVAIFKKL